MNIDKIMDGESLAQAKKRVSTRCAAFDEKQEGIMLLRARAAMLSYAQSHDDWDNICAWFDELARYGFS